MNAPTTHDDLRDQLAKLELLVAQVESESFPEDVVQMAHEELSEVKAAHQALSEYDDASLAVLITEKDAKWQDYVKKADKAEAWFASLL